MLDVIKKICLDTLSVLCQLLTPSASCYKLSGLKGKLNEVASRGGLKKKKEL